MLHGNKIKIMPGLLDFIRSRDGRTAATLDAAGVTHADVCVASTHTGFSFSTGVGEIVVIIEGTPVQLVQFLDLRRQLTLPSPALIYKYAQEISHERKDPDNGPAVGPAGAQSAAGSTTPA